MTDKQAVAWMDGLLMQPQHLEQQERATFYQLHKRTQYTQAYLWGIESIRVETDLLTNNKIKLTQLKGVFQDGTAFDLDEQDLEHCQLTIQNNMINKKIYIAIATNDTFSETPSDAVRYYLTEQNIASTNYQDTTSIPMVTKQLNIKLMIEDNITDNYWVIPILKIQKADADKGIYLDDDFIPPNIDALQNRHLKKYLNTMIEQVTRKQGQLSAVMLSPLQAKSLHTFTDLNLLQLMNKYQVRLSQMITRRFLSPYELYTTLSILLAELSTFYCQNRKAIEVPKYDHLAIGYCFDYCMDKLNDMLTLHFEHQAKQLSLKNISPVLFETEALTSTQIKKNIFIITIQQQDKRLREKLLKNIKVAGVDDMSDLIRLQLAGIAIESLDVIPPQLPFLEDTIYLKLKQSDPHWTTLSNQGVLSIYLPHHGMIDLKIWMIPKYELDNQQGEKYASH